MPKYATDPAGSGTEGEDGGEGAPRQYTQEEVEGLLEGQRRDLQGNLTRAQQEAAEWRRRHEDSTGETRERIAALEARISQSGKRGAPDSDEDDADWDGITSGADLKRAVRELARREAKRAGDSSGGDDPRLKAALAAAERVEEIELERDFERLRAKYPGLSTEEERQIIDLAKRTGVGNLEYLAYELMGPSQRGGAASNGSERRASHAVLPGRAKANGNPEPLKVKVPRGQKGWRTIEKIALDYAEKHGR